MSYFIWKNSFNTNIHEIDAQHQHIFSVFNRLSDAVQCSEDNYSAIILLREMNDYASSHFKTEEKLMARFAYKGLDSQIKQHSYYREQMILLSNAFETKNASACTSLLQFLTDWLLNHILQEDMKFAEVTGLKKSSTMSTESRRPDMSV